MKQETLKGHGTLTLVGRSWSGWGFEHPTYTTNINGLAHTFDYYPNVAAINAAPADQLRDIPVFRHNPSGMFTNAISAATRDEILARGIPALSEAAGRTMIPELTSEMNYNMDTTFKPVGGSWGRDDTHVYQKRWLHNDMKDMAYFYTSKLFDNLTDTGALK